MSNGVIEMLRTCPIGSAGVGGECHACDFPLMQDGTCSLFSLSKVRSKAGSYTAVKIDGTSPRPFWGVNGTDPLDKHQPCFGDPTAGMPGTCAI